MGKDIEILEEQINKLAADKEAKLANPDLTDEERQNVEESFNKALEGFEQGLVKLGLETKAKIQAAISNYETEIKENENYIKSAEEELAKRKAEIEEELAKENPDMGLVEAKTAEIKALEKRIKELKSAIRKANKEVKEQKKLLIPIMYKFKDKVFSEEEIAELEKLDKKIQAGKKLSEKMNAEKSVESENEKEETTEPAKDENEKEEVAEQAKVENEKEVAAEEVKDESEKEAAEPAKNENKEKSTGTKAVVMVVQEEPEVKKTLKDEFNELYLKAKKGNLDDKDFYRLAEIMSDAKNYDECEITTGVLDNKAKVVLKAMGKYATKNEKELVTNGRKDFAISKIADADNLIDTKKSTKWGGIKKLAKNPGMKTKSQVTCKKIMTIAPLVDGLSEEQVATYEEAKQHLDDMQMFRSSISAYSKVKEERTNRMFGWLRRNNNDVPALDDSVKLEKPRDLSKELGGSVVETPVYESKEKTAVSKEEMDKFGTFEDIDFKY